MSDHTTCSGAAACSDPTYGDRCDHLWGWTSAVCSMLANAAGSCALWLKPRHGMWAAGPAVWSRQPWRPRCNLDRPTLFRPLCPAGVAGAYLAL